LPRQDLTAPPSTSTPPPPWATTASNTANIACAMRHARFEQQTGHASSRHQAAALPPLPNRRQVVQASCTPAFATLAEASPQHVALVSKHRAALSRAKAFEPHGNSLSVGSARARGAAGEDAFKRVPREWRAALGRPSTPMSVASGSYRSCCTSLPAAASEVSLRTDGSAVSSRLHTLEQMLMEEREARLRLEQKLAQVETLRANGAFPLRVSTQAQGSPAVEGLGRSHPPTSPSTSEAPSSIRQRAAELRPGSAHHGSTTSAGRTRTPRGRTISSQGLQTPWAPSVARNA